MSLPPLVLLIIGLLIVLIAALTGAVYQQSRLLDRMFAITMQILDSQMHAQDEAIQDAQRPSPRRHVARIYEVPS